MASRSGTLRVRIIGDAKPFQDTLGGLGSKVAGFAKVAAAAGATAAAAFGVKALTSAVELNETLSKTNQVFGDAAGQVTGFADEMASAFGLPKQEMLDAASNIGLVAKASGLSEDAAAGMSTEMAQLAADASSFFNVPLPEALEKIRSGLVGEAEPLRAFGVLLSAAAVEEKAVAMGIAEAGEELTEQQKVMARSAIITEQMSDASGDLERTQDSLANRWRKLQGQAQNFAAEVGMKLIPVVERLWDWFDNSLAPALADAGRTLQTNLGPAFATVRDLIAEWGPVVGDAIGRAVTVLRDLWTTAQQVFGQVRAFLHDNRETIATWRDSAVQIFGQIREVVASVFGAIQTIIQTKINILTEFWNRFGRHLVDFLVRTVTRIIEVVQGAFQVLKGVFDLIKAVLTGQWGDAWEAIKGIVAGAWRIIRNVVAGAWDALKTAFGAGVAAISQVWSFLWDQAKKVLRNAWDAIVETVARKVFEAKQAFDGIVSFVRELPGRVASAARGMWDSIWAGFREMINRVIRGWNNLSFTIPAIDVPGPFNFEGATVSTPNLPTLAQGGVLPANRPTLAVVGDNRTQREIVTPEDLMRQVVREETGRRAGDVHQHFYGPVTEQITGRASALALRLA